MSVRQGGGLNFVTGPMGSGKSLYGTRRIVQAVTASSYAVSNVELLPGWSERVAWKVARWSPRWRRGELARRFEQLYIYEADLERVMAYRVPGKGEARAIMVWDETHNDLGNRTWKDSGRGAILEWASQLRKLGYTGYLLSQHHENTDAALRRICNFLVRLQNQREQTRFLGMRVTPWPLFLAAWYPTHVHTNAGRAITPMRTERYFLDWHRHLYDTHGLYHGLAGELDEDELGVIRLPELPPIPRRKPRKGELVAGGAASTSGLLTTLTPDSETAPVERGRFGHSDEMSPRRVQLPES